MKKHKKKILLIAVILVVATLTFGYKDILFIYYLDKAEHAELSSNLHEAIDYYDRLLEIKESNYEILFNKAGAYADLKEYDEALKIYNEIMLINDKDFELFWSIGLTYFNMSNYNMALKMLDSAIELNTDAFEVYLDIADTYKCKGNDEKAKAYYTEYLEHYPDDVSAYNKLLEVSTNENK